MLTLIPFDVTPLQSADCNWTDADAVLSDYSIKIDFKEPPKENLILLCMLEYRGTFSIGKDASIELLLERK